MIKKIILITGLTISTSLWASPMDKECWVKATNNEVMPFSIWQKIEDQCERNNIFKVDNLTNRGLHGVISKWCRFDREINYYKDEEVKQRNNWMMSCVLYDNKPRKKGLFQPIQFYPN